MKVTLLAFFSLILSPERIQAQTEKETEKDDSLRPWQNPLQELQRVTPNCAVKMPEILEITSKELNLWQICVDKIIIDVTEKYPELDSRNNRTKKNDNTNSTEIYEIDRQLHMVICRNRTAYKACWLGIIKALNKCDPGSGNVAGRIYYALYDDICRDGGRITVENRRKAALEGNLCERDYSVNACKINQQNQYSKDLCLRFHSNVACDLSSVDVNCTNLVDKELHADIFERVQKVLGCTQTSSSEASKNSKTTAEYNSASALLGSDDFFLNLPFLLTFSYSIIYDYLFHNKLLSSFSYL